MSHSIAAVDYRLWESDPAEFATCLGNSFQRYGFAVVAHHTLRESLIKSCLAGFMAFFARPEPEKLRYRVPGGGGARGYTPFGVEAAKGAELHDLKEFWHVGRELPVGDRYRAYMPDNLWPDTQPGFREQVLELWEGFDRLGRELLSALALHLGLPARWFDAATDHGNSILRVIHYPPVTAGAAGVRAGAHEDINAITLLLGAEEAGLQVLDRDGCWLDINPPAGSLVCNIGDMLQRLTNHVLPSTTHRVINPAPERAGFSRYSMPFFLHFNPDFEISSLPGCVSETRPDRYLEPITANEYLHQRLREIRLL